MTSLILRRTHMYLGLFLAPWILMYALSTLAMNHRGEEPAAPRWRQVRETRFEGALPEGAVKARAAALLASVGEAGAFATQRRDGQLIVTRLAAVAPLRITLTEATGRVLIERQEFRASAFLERMHRRRGYAQPFAADKAWAATVDAFIAAMLVWALSGIWLWWEMRATRRWGALAAASGVLVFAAYLAVL